MAWMFCTGACAQCGKVFSFNPDLVPSVRVRGQKEPICKTCIDLANIGREQIGVDPITILPGAYEPQEVS